MPIYDYICNACGQEQEISHSVNAPNVKECPLCKENQLQKLVTAPSSIVFNGGGFYETDYKRKEKKDKVESSVAATQSTGNSCKHNKSVCACAN